MPEIIIQKREDITDNVKINLNGNIRIIKREEKISISDGELDILMNSHEKPYIFVIPPKEDINADTSSPIGVELNLGRDETGTRTNPKFR